MSNTVQLKVRDLHPAAKFQYHGATFEIAEITHKVKVHEGARPVTHIVTTTGENLWLNPTLKVTYF